MSFNYLTNNNTSVRNDDLQQKLNAIFDMACEAIEKGMANYIHTKKGDQAIGLCAPISAFAKSAYAISEWTRSWELCDELVILDGNLKADEALRTLINCIYDAGRTLCKDGPKALQTVRSELYGATTIGKVLITELRAKVHTHASDSQGGLDGQLHLGLLVAENYYFGQSTEYGLRNYQNVRREMKVSDQADIQAAWGAWLNMCYGLTVIVDAIGCICDTGTLGEVFFDEEAIFTQTGKHLNDFKIVGCESSDVTRWYLYNSYWELLVDRIWYNTRAEEFASQYEENL